MRRKEGLPRVATPVRGDVPPGKIEIRESGFRYLVAKRYGFEMGLDVAWGPEDTVFYIQGGTAWR